jgi:heat shock protein HslJ
VVGLSVATLIAGCGADDTAPDGTVDGTVDTADGPRVADPRFEGDFVVTAVEVDGASVEAIQLPRIMIETRFGGLTVQPGCNVYFGSFTLGEDGTASFTVTGGSDQDCGDLTGQETAILAALDGATSWTTIDGGFRFDGPTTSLTLTGPER